MGGFLADSRDDATSEERALKVLLQYFRQEPVKLHCVGAISLWLCGGYPIHRVEKMMEDLVTAGTLRRATPQELKELDCHPDHQGYFVTPEGLTSLPPEDRSYGATWRLV